jgi:hypothetical protein
LTEFGILNDLVETRFAYQQRKLNTCATFVTECSNGIPEGWVHAHRPDLQIIGSHQKRADGVEMMEIEKADFPIPTPREAQRVSKSRCMQL